MSTESTRYHNLNNTDVGDHAHHKKLSNGALAGIIVASSVIFVLLVILIIWLCGGFKKHGSGGSGDSDGSGSSSRFGKIAKGAQFGFGAYNIYELYNKAGGGTGILKLFEDAAKFIFKIFI